MLNKYVKIAGLTALLFASTVNASELPIGFSVGINGEKGVYTRENRDILDTSKIKDNTKVGNTWAASVDLEQFLDGGLAAGGEFGYRISRQKPKNGDTTTTPSTENEMFTVLATAAYFGEIGILNPYAKVGIGGAKINFTHISADAGKDITLADGYKIAYQIELGVAGVVSDNALVTASAKYFGLTDIDKDDATDIGKVFFTGIDGKQSLKAHTGDLTIQAGFKLIVS